MASQMEYDLTVERDMVQYMSVATSESDWNKRTDDVKRANGGYPRFWYPAIILSGVAAKTAEKWGGDADLHVTTLD